MDSRIPSWATKLRSKNQLLRKEIKALDEVDREDLWLGEKDAVYLECGLNLPNHWVTSGDICFRSGKEEMWAQVTEKSEDRSRPTMEHSSEKQGDVVTVLEEHWDYNTQIQQSISYRDSTGTIVAWEESRASNDSEAALG